MNNNNKKTFWQKLKRLVKNRNVPCEIRKLMMKEKIKKIIKELFKGK